MPFPSSRLGAKPFLERLETAMTRQARGAASPSHLGPHSEVQAQTVPGEV